MIDINVLKSNGADIINFNSGDIIFNEGDIPEFYYQIDSGSVKLFNRDSKSRELTQAIIFNDNAICDFALLTERPYPVSAQGLTDTTVLRLSKKTFCSLSRSEIGLSLAKQMSEITYFKFIMGSIYLMRDPIDKLEALMDFLKAGQNNVKDFSYQIPLTRQQLADLIGLRVETTIRSIKQMERDGLLKIINHKVFY
ncbi:Crp/Fnr family transcriptional regulator [Epilithonimonas sp.]|uniref:Crp/Fnr family transcriptional regulator n=1 Tax=Epilithonimonas sp. TaxID=2894511 RepID=UPI0028A017ED|nr:Crp/Fnr family transcriptional regulator [Epilithonimonas sp.]